MLNKKIRLVGTGITLISAISTAFADSLTILNTDTANNISASVGANNAGVMQSAYATASGSASNIANVDAQQASTYYNNYQQYTAQANYEQSLASATHPAGGSVARIAQANASAMANQDTQLANEAYSAYQAWTTASNGASAISRQQTTQSAQQGVLATTQQTAQGTTYTSAVSDALPASVQLASQATQNGTVANNTATNQIQIADTGVQQGQVAGALPTDTGYLVGGATAMAGMGVTTQAEATANIAAATDYTTANACGIVPGCYPAWMAANAVQQNIANADFASAMSTAPIIGASVISSATTSGQQSATQVGSAITAQTGVQQGVPAGFNVMTAPLTQSTDTSYLHSADGLNAVQIQAEQQNLSAGVANQQAWTNAQSAQTTQNADQAIATQDASLGASAQSIEASQAYNSASAIASASANQAGATVAQQTSLQQQAISTESTTSTTAMSTAIPSANALNASAGTSANNAFAVQMQQINSLTR